MYPGQHVDAHPDKPALVVYGSGTIQTYRELDAAANRLSRVFRRAGLNPGDHVALCLENHPRFLEIVWGCEYAGLVYTALSTRLTAEELEYIITDCGAEALVTSAKQSGLVSTAAASSSRLKLRLMVDGVGDGFESYEDAMSAEAANPLDDRIAGCDMLYSSGTTGRPKGILPLFTSQPLETRVTVVTRLMNELFNMRADKTYLSPAPLYHSAPMRFCLATTAIGGTVVLMPQFDPESFLAALEDHRVTHTQVVPTMFVRLLKLPYEVRSRNDHSSLEVAIHAAAPCAVSVKRRMIEWWGPVLHEYYAGTEGNGLVYCDTKMWLEHEGTVGSSYLGTVHVLDEEGQDQPAGVQGDIYFEGGPQFEYHNDEAKTAASRNTKGWTTLGDVGYLDADGFLYLTDRKAYTIVVGGVNVYPQEAEDILVGHPKVMDVAVFGVPNEEYGEEVKAVVQPMHMPASHLEQSELERELLDYCTSRLSAIKCPRSIDFRPELPRHPTGKLYKRLLKEEWWGRSGRMI